MHPEQPSRLRRWLCRHGWHKIVGDFPPACYWCGPPWKWGDQEAPDA